MSEHNLGDFSVGGVLSKSFNTLFRNFIPFASLGLLVFLPFVGYGFLVLGTADIQAFGAVTGGWLGALLSMLLYFVLIYMVYGAITFGTIRDLRGQQANFGEILSRGFATMFPVLGVAIVMTILIVFGFFLLIIPGAILSVMLYVAIPVAVIERPGIFKSLSRSAELTKELKWNIFGLAILAGIIVAVFTSLGTIFFDASTAIGAIIYLITNAISTAFGAVVAAVTYQELRRIKEGVDINTIASVFS